MKKYIFGILAVAMAIGFSAFTTKSAKKPFTDTDVYYKTGICNQLIAPGVTDEDCRESSLFQTTFENINSWSTTDNSGVTFTNGAYIAALSFPYEAAEDGTSDDLINPKEAAQAVWAAYVGASPDLLTNGQTVQLGSGAHIVTITVRLKSAVR